MKIPETSANVGAYYGNEENGQWQPNGVIIDNGVGGGVVGSGDAGVRPVYPVHIPRHMPAGYVMAGAYYPPQFAPPVPPQPADFEDYMWMENEEEFDKQVIQQLEEEALMEQCIEAMLEDEQRERRGRRAPRPRDPNAPTTSSCNGNPGLSLEEAVSKSTLNPLAAEFVPTRVRLPPANPNPPSTATIKAETTEAPITEVPNAVINTEAASTEEKEPSRTDAADSEPVEETKPEINEDIKIEESLTPPKDPPEVSAADVQPIQKSKPKDKRPETKKPPKIVQEIKKIKPVVVRSEPKVQKETKEVKVSKSEVEESASSTTSEDSVDSAPQIPSLIPTVIPCVVASVGPTVVPTVVPSVVPPVVPPVTSFVAPVEEPISGPKPINYAAAAKAMKPKPKPTERELKPIDKEPKPIEKEPKPVEKKDLKLKSTAKPKDKVRKNSTK